MHDRRHSLKRRTWLVAAGLIVTAGFGALWQHERVESWLTGLGLLRADALRCEPELGLQASYRLRMHTQIKINAAALLADARKPQGDLIATSAGFSGRLRLQALEQRKPCRRFTSSALVCGAKPKSLKLQSGASTA